MSWLATTVGSSPQTGALGGNHTPVLATKLVRWQLQQSCGSPVVVVEPSEHGLDRDGLLDIDSLHGKSVTKTQPWPAGDTSENLELVAEGGILDDEFTSRAAAEIGRNLQRFNASRKRGELRPKATADCEDTPGDGGDYHGEVRPRFR